MILLEAAFWLTNDDDYRRLYAAKDDELAQNPNALRLFFELAAETDPEAWQTVEKTPLFRFAAWLRKGQTNGLVLPYPLRGRFGWLAEVPDETTAAAWELALMVVHNVRRMHRCSDCGRVFCGRQRLCLKCKKPVAKKQPTERSRFLNLLAQWVKRGKITHEQRDRAGLAFLAQNGLEAAKKILVIPKAGKTFDKVEETSYPET